MTDKENAKLTDSKKDLAPESEVLRITKLIAEIKKTSGGHEVGTSLSDELTTIDLEPLETNADPEVQAKTYNKDPLPSFDDLYLTIKEDLDTLVESYKLKARLGPVKLQILSDFDRIIDGTYSTEAEISIPVILSSADTKKVEDLFILLEEELSSKTKKIKLRQMPLSATTILNRGELEEVFQELGEKIIEETEEQTQEATNFLEEIPYATVSHIFFAFLFDFLVFFGLSIYIVSKYTADPISFYQLRPFLINHFPLISMIFFALWFPIQALSLILVQGALGQSLTSVIVATEDNKTPSIPTLLKRLSLHFFNFLTLGLYSAVIIRCFLAKDKSGIYCPISRTKLVFRGFLKE